MHCLANWLARSAMTFTFTSVSSSTEIGKEGLQHQQSLYVHIYRCFPQVRRKRGGLHLHQSLFKFSSRKRRASPSSKLPPTQEEERRVFSPPYLFQLGGSRFFFLHHNLTQTRKTVELHLHQRLNFLRRRQGSAHDKHTFPPSSKISFRLKYHTSGILLLSPETNSQYKVELLT